MNFDPEGEILLVTCTPTIQIVGKKNLRKKDLPKIMNDVKLLMSTSEKNNRYTGGSMILAGSFGQ